MPHVPEAGACWRCHKILDGATFVSDDTKRPTPGDWSLCVYCNALAVFGDDGRLRKPTTAEADAARADPKVRAHRRAIRRLIHERVSHARRN